AVFDDDSAPIAANRRARANINIFPDDHVAGYCSLRMDKTAFVDDRDKSFEFVYHIGSRFSVRGTRFRVQGKQTCTRYPVLNLYLNFCNVFFVNSDNTKRPLMAARSAS